MAKVTMHPKKKGQKPVTFNKGGLHETTNTPAGEKIPVEKIRAALAGRYGPKGKKQAVMAQGMLKKGRKTAAKNRKKAKPVSNHPMPAMHKSMPKSTPKPMPSAQSMWQTAYKKK